MPIVLAIVPWMGRTPAMRDSPEQAETASTENAGGGRRWPWLQIVTVTGFVLLAVFFFLPKVDVAGMVNALRVSGPWVFYFAFAILTLIGLPSTPFFLVGGATFPLWQNLLGTTLGMTFHFTLAYLISSRWMRKTIRRVLENRGITPPAVRPGNEWKVAFMIKFAPGVPMFLKSYIMGVAGIPWKVYMCVSMPATWLYALAFLTLGRSAMEGSIGWLMGGVALLIFTGATVRYIKSRGRPV